MSAKSQPLTNRLPAERQNLALEGFFQIMHRWKVDNATARRLLGSPAERTFFAWKSNRTAARLPEDTLRRIGYVAGIWKALQILYSDPELADAWVSRPNAFFGQTPLERMAAGDVTDLAAVRAYVNAARSPWS